LSRNSRPRMAPTFMPTLDRSGHCDHIPAAAS
jgi:hypothetical protein